MAMVFSTLVPYVPVFAGFFFAGKYFVDKYNLSFVYNCEWQGMGVIKRRVVPLTTFNIILYQIVNVGFFASKAEAKNLNFLYTGVALVAVEIIGLTIFHWSDKSKRRRQHKEMRER